MNIFFWLAAYVFKAFFYIFYRYRVYGTQHIRPGKALIAPNHASFLDPPLIGIASPEEVHFLARASLFNSWLNKILLIRLNAHPVHGSMQDLTSFKTVCQLLQEDKKVVIFPEGIRSFNGQLQPIKTGIAMLALRAKCPIIPTYIQGTFEAWPRFKTWPKLKGRVVCIFGKPICIESYLHLEKKKAQEMLSEHVQHSLENLRDWFNQGAIGDPP